MSINTDAKLNKSITIKEIKTAITKHYELKNVEQYSDHSYQIIFNVNGNQRMLSIFIGKNYGTEPDIENHLSLGQNSEAIEVMKTILSYFGGWLDENDTDNQDFYWIDKTRSFDNQEEINNDNRIFSILNKSFSYNEIQKIIANKDVIKEAFNF